MDFGVQLFGERIGWSLKEMWVNVLETGGHQAMHNHANSFISGVVYLTPTHAGSQTVFMKSPGGTDFTFRNDHHGTTPNEFHADKWISPAPRPGDMVLFPSFLMHAVPPNQGERRIFPRLQRHSDPAGLMGLRHPVQRLIPLGPSPEGVMVASGFAGLGYQVVWTQQSALWLGHEAAGVLAVVTAFFGGLARRRRCWRADSSRNGVQSSTRQPGQPFGGTPACEIVIAVVERGARVRDGARQQHALLELTGVQPSPVWQWSVAFVGTFLSAATGNCGDGRNACP